MAEQREFFVSFKGELTDHDRRVLTRPGWKLYENGVGSTAAFRGDVPPVDAPITWRQIVRLPARSVEEASGLVVGALGIVPEDLRVEKGRRPLLQQDSPRHFELIRHAAQLMREHRYDFAVITAQTACEVYVEATVGDLLERRRLGPLGDAISDTLVTLQPARPARPGPLGSLDRRARDATRVVGQLRRAHRSAQQACSQGRRGDRR